MQTIRLHIVAGIRTKGMKHQHFEVHTLFSAKQHTYTGFTRSLKVWGKWDKLFQGLESL